MGRHELTASKVVAAPAAAVWKAVSDVGEIPTWFPGCTGATLVDAERPAVGVVRVLELAVAGRTVRSEQEITEYEPRTRFGWRHVMDTVDGRPFEMLEDPGLHFTLSAGEGGTRIDVVAQWETRGLRAALAGPMVKRVVAEQTEKVLERLRLHLEG